MSKEVSEYIIESKSRFSLGWKELWDYRELFYFFTWRDLKVKYKQTVLGIVWVVLQPLLLMMIFTFFFGRMLGVQPEGMTYPVFAFSGLLLWNFFAASITNAGQSMVTNAAIINKIYFPRIIIPLSSILAAIIDLGVTFVLFGIFLVFMGTRVDVSALLFWPTAFLLSLVGAIGMGCLLAALMVKYRDFRFIVPFAIQIAFFVTPIVYPVSKISIPYLKYILALNPMYGAVTLFRQPMTTAGAPDLVLISISIFSALVLLLTGFMYFRRTELFFADIA